MTTLASALAFALATRHSTRKRQVPVRYGFDWEPQQQSKRSRSSNSLELLDLPEDILKTVCGYLCTVSDLFALQTTNKLFRNISNASDMRRNMCLLPATTTTSSSTSTTTDNVTMVSIVQPNDTAEKVCSRLLPFARVQNQDALFLLGRVATYVEDDMEAGMSLLQKGADLGDVRCKYEMANLLIRNRRHPTSIREGQQMILEAAAAQHAPSLICSPNPPVGEARRPVYDQAAREMKSTSAFSILMDLKPLPPRTSWIGSSCSNPWCSRQCYRVRRRRARNWLKQKPFTQYWKEMRPLVMECSGGLQSPHYCADTLFCVPDFHVCARCMQADYCGRACQVIHWATHKSQCQPPRGAI